MLLLLDIAMEMDDMKFGVELLMISGQLCGIQHDLWRRRY